MTNEKTRCYSLDMEYINNNLENNIKVMSAAAGLSLADVARRIGDSPQAFNNKLKTGKMQKDIDYLQKVAAACGYRFKWDFIKE